ncbi:MAG: DUF411 domain-containing protein, partial [Candidatus Accumulibacter sp.]|nr:DUF411 domain-containing protein [Accumulibacter sp.]
MKPVRILSALALLSVGSVYAESAPRIEVYKNASCSCCGGWVDHLRQNGFEVSSHDVDDVSANRKKLGMPERLGSC